MLATDPNPAGPLRAPALSPDIQARLWLERPTALLDSARAAHGPLFELTLGAVGRVAIVGSVPLAADAFAVPKDAYRVGPFNRNYGMVMGEHGLFLLDGAPHRRIKRMVAPLFRARALAGREDVVAAETRRVLGRGLADGQVPLRLAAHEITLRAFLRGALGDDAALIESLVEMLRDRVWTDLRQWKAWTRLSRLRPALREALAPAIAARRAHPGRGDTLDLMVQARDDDGTALSDDQLFDSFMSFLGTAGDGTSIMLAWGLDLLARAPDWQARIRAEDATGPRPALEAVLQEVLRLQPLLPTVSGRVLARPVTLGGHVVEAGVALAPCMWLVHRDPDLWDDAAAFRPERFLTGTPPPGALFPFGGKERACPGQSLGRLTLRAALRAAVELARLRPGTDTPPAPSRFATMLAPPQDLLLRLDPERHPVTQTPAPPEDTVAAPAPDRTIVDLLCRRAATTPDALAYGFLEDGKREADRTTYAALDADARRIATGLLRDHAPGKRALILLPQGVDVLRAFFGCLYAGIIPIPAPAPEASRRKRTLPRLQAVARDAGVDLVLSAGDTLDLLRDAQDHAPEMAAARMVDIASVTGAPDAGWTPHRAAPDDVAYLQYSSGSTGTPKGVEITHRNVLHQCRILRAAAGYGPDSVTLTWLPYFHDYGLVEGMLLPLQNGTPSWLMSPFAFLKRPVGWLEAMGRLKATHAQAPNFAWDQCLRRLRPGQLEAMDLSHVVALGNAAEPINPETTDRFVEVFAAAGLRPGAMCPAYGLAEATLIMSHSAPTQAPRAPGFDPVALTERRAVPSDAPGARRIQSCGPPIGGVDVAIVDPDTRARLPEGRIGEIWLADPSIARGYWGQPDTTRDIFQANTVDGAGPFLRTGDLGFLHGGELYLSGRLKDLIIIAGQNHYPMDIEWTVEGAHDAIRPGHVAAAALPGAGPERLVVVAEVERGHLSEDAGRDDLLRAVTAAVAETHEIPLHALVLLRRGSIPKTASGKIRRHACADLAEAPTADVVALWSGAGGWRQPIPTEGSTA